MASQNNATAEYTTLIADLKHEMAEQEDTTMKEPRPNNLEEAKEYQKQTKKALQKFTERIHSFDGYQYQSAYEFYVHDVLNEHLCTDNSHYKNAEIQPVLDTIHNKMCKFVLQPDDIDEQPSQQQSPDDIFEAEEITDKLAEIEDMEELDERSVKSITSLFAALQMCLENSAKMAGHLVQLVSTLTPKQYTYVMKHSLRPLVQLSLPPSLCSPADLKFSKLHLTPQETKEEISINQCLPRPFHLALAVLAPKHPTHCLAAIIHPVLWRHLFNSKESSSTISEEFQVTPKKLYEGLAGKWYDPGQKLTKAEKAAQEAAKVTSSTPSATSSTPSATLVDVKSEVPTTEDPSKGAVPKNNRNLAQANNKNQSSSVHHF